MDRRRQALQIHATGPQGFDTDDDADSTEAQVEAQVMAKALIEANAKHQEQVSGLNEQITKLIKELEMAKAASVEATHKAQGVEKQLQEAQAKAAAAGPAEAPSTAAAFNLQLQELCVRSNISARLKPADVAEALVNQCNYYCMPGQHLHSQPQASLAAVLAAGLDSMTCLNPEQFTNVLLRQMRMKRGRNMLNDPDMYDVENTKVVEDTQGAYKRLKAADKAVAREKFEAAGHSMTESGWIHG